MEKFEYNGVDLSLLLPRIPENEINGLPFGFVKVDLTGKILEYNMAEGEITGVDPKWALGRNFFDEVALCTKTNTFYGRFVEGVQKRFLNTTFDYVFDHRSEGVRVKVHMVMIPNHLGEMVVIITVRRMDKPRVEPAVTQLPPERQAMIEAALAEMRRVAEGKVDHTAAPAPLPGDRAVVKPSAKPTTSTGHVDIISF
jgi:photoactive yellow protein